MFCPKCGNTIDDGSTTCSFCGAQFVLLDPQSTDDTQRRPTDEQPTYQGDAIDEEQMWLPQSPDGYYQKPVDPVPVAEAYQPTDASWPQPTAQRPVAAQQTAYQQPLYSQPYDEFATAQAPQKSRLPLVLGIAAAVILVFGVVAFAATHWSSIVPGTPLAEAVMSDEDKIRQKVEMAINADTEMSEADIEALIGADESAILKAYGIDLPQLVRRMMGYLDHEVGEVAVDGDTAKAKLILSFPDFDALQEKFFVHVMAEISSEDFTSLVSGDTSVLYECIVDMLFETIDAYPNLRVSTEADIDLTKQPNGDWEVDEQDVDGAWETLFEDVSGEIGDYTSMV